MVRYLRNIGNSRPLGPMALAVEDSVPVLGMEVTKGELLFFSIAFRTGREGRAVMDGVGMDGSWEKHYTFVEGVFV